MVTNQRILITGARGFLGSHIIAHAKAAGLDVIAGYREASGAGTAALDICDVESVEAAFRETSPAFVIHCAAYGVNYTEQDPERALAVNVHGSLSVLKAAASHNVRRFVHIGSCFEYGSRPDPIPEDAPLNPTGLYGATKAAATLLMRERAHALGIPLVVARPFGLWGPGEAGHRLIPQIIAACVSRSALKLTPCEVIRDYMYVEDAAANLLALTLKGDVPAGNTINVATGQRTVLRDFVLSIASFFSAEDLMQFGALPYRPTEMPSLVADAKLMHRFLGGGPTTPVAEGVRRMVVRSGLPWQERIQPVAAQ